MRPEIFSGLFLFDRTAVMLPFTSLPNPFPPSPTGNCITSAACRIGRFQDTERIENEKCSWGNMQITEYSYSDYKFVQ